MGLTLESGPRRTSRTVDASAASERTPTPRMRLILNGQDVFAKNAMDALLADGHEIVGVVATTKEGDPLRQAAIEQGIPIIDLGKVNTKEARKTMRGWKADIAVGAYLQKELKIDTITVPISKKTINFHPSDLPKRRGRSSQNWAIIQGDEVMAVAAYEMDEGMDTGPVIKKIAFPIPEGATQNSLYKDKVAPEGVNVLVEAVREYAIAIDKGRRTKKKIVYPNTPQDETLATSDPPITEEHARLRFHQMTATEAHNMIRGAQNTPGANIVSSDGTVVKMFDSEVYPGPTTQPGSIHVGEEVILFETKQGLVGVKTMREIKGEVKGKPVKAVDYVREKGLPL